MPTPASPEEPTPGQLHGAISRSRPRRCRRTRGARAVITCATRSGCPRATPARLPTKASACTDLAPGAPPRRVSRHRVGARRTGGQRLRHRRDADASRNTVPAARAWSTTRRTTSLGRATTTALRRTFSQRPSSTPCGCTTVCSTSAITRRAAPRHLSCATTSAAWCRHGYGLLRLRRRRGLRLRVPCDEYLSAEVVDEPPAWEPDDDDLADVEQWLYSVSSPGCAPVPTPVSPRRNAAAGAASARSAPTARHRASRYGRRSGRPSTCQTHSL